jgi:RHS repeat-associated protein
VGGAARVSALADPPALSLEYRSDVGAAQSVCHLDEAAGLKELCFAGFPSREGTLCCWLRVPVSAAATGVLLRYEPPAASGAPALTLVDPGDLELRVGTAASGPTAVAVTDDVWHQLAITYRRLMPNAWEVGLFLDSLPLWRSRGLRSNADLAAGGDLYLGWGGSEGTALAGMVSELQVWDRALSERELATGLLRRAVDGAPGLALHWPLDVPPPGNPNARIVASQLRFRTGAARLSWGAVAAATGYDVEAGSTDGTCNAVETLGPVTSHALPGAPLAARLGARVRARMASGPGPWSATTEISAFELGQSAVALEWNASDGTLLATWPDVPRRESYTLELQRAGDPQPTVTTGYRQLSYPLTDKLDDPAPWRLDVRAFAAGSLGPAQPAPALTAPSLRSVVYDAPAERLDLRWDALDGAQLYRLRIVPQSGSQQPYTATLPGSTTTLSVSHAEYLLAMGVSYGVELRALGHGTLSAWAEATVAIHDVPAPTLGWALAPAPALLEATWNEVAPAATYDLALYRGDGVEPIERHDGLTTRAFSLAPQLDVDDRFALRVAALDRGVKGPANVPGTPLPLAPRFHYLVATHRLEADWATDQGDAYLRVLKGAEAVQTALGSQSHASFDAPVDIYPEGTAVTLQGRALAPGALGRIESAALTVHLLAGPAPELHYEELADAPGAEPRLTLRWPAINPPLAVAYQAQTTIAGQAGPIRDVPGTELVVTELLDAAGAIAVAVRGTTDGSIGPWSDGAAPAAPVWQSVHYDQAAAQLDAAWTAPAGLAAIYVELLRDGVATPVLRRWLAGDSTSVSFQVPSELAGQAVTLRARAVLKGTLSEIAAATLTLAQVAGPVLAPLSDSLDPKSISASWQFDVPAGMTGLGYVVELRHDGAVLATAEIDDPSTKQTTFGESERVHFEANTLYVVRVRARVAPAAGQTILGAWSADASINFGAHVDLALERLAASSDTEGDLSVSWALRTQVPDVTFELEIPAVDFRRTGLTGTLVELPQSETHVVLHTEYTLRMRAVYQGAVFGEWRSTTVTAGEPPPPPPSPGRNDPVSIRSGALVQTGVDLLVPAVVPLTFTVTYRSDSPLPEDEHGMPSAPLGRRWSHVYNVRVERASDGRSVALVGGDLTVVIYDAPASITGSYSQRGIPDGSTLVVDAGLAYTLTHADQSVLRFDAEGRLLWRSDPVGNRTELSYAGGRLQRVTDVGSQRWLELTYDANGRIERVQASTGVAISYRYDEVGNLVESTDPLGNKRGYGYDARSLMTDATDPLERHSLHNEFDAQGRVTLQQDARALARGERYGTQFDYRDEHDARAVVVTNRVGEVTTYRFHKGSGALVEETVELSPGTVWRTRYGNDANGNPLTREVFEGPADSQAPGQLWRYTYDGIGNVTSVTDPLGGVETVRYDAANRPVRLTDRLGNATELRWRDGLLERIVDPLGGETALDYDPGPIRGLLTRLTDRYGATVQLRHDALGQLERAVDPTGAVSLPHWSDRGWPRGFTRQAADGATVYDQVRETDAMGQPVERAERYASQPAERAFRTTREYWPTGMPKLIVDALGGRTEAEYDPNLLLERVTYPGGAQRTVYGYDREDRLTSIDYGAQVIEGFGDDALDRPISYTDPNGSVWRGSYAMDGANLVQTVTLPIDHPQTGQPLTRAVTLDPLGRIVARRNCDGGVTRYDHERVPIAGTDTHGLRITTTLPRPDPAQPLQYTRSVTLDALGRIVESVDERERRTTFSYARASSVVPDPGDAVLAVTITRPTGLVELQLLDGVGQLLETRRGTAPDERRAHYSYDPLGRLVEGSERGADAELRATCGYAWGDGEIIATVASAGREGPVLRFDALGQLVAERDRAGQTTTYGYTPAGLLERWTNARGQQLEYRYDAAARLTEIVLPDAAGSIEHRLDHNGNRRESLLAGVVQVQRHFDALDRPQSRTDAAGQTVGYAYDALGGLAALEYPAPAGQAPPRVTYRRDGLGRLTHVTDWAGRTTSYGYLPTGVLEWSEAPNGVRADYRYDDDGRLTAATTKLGTLVVADAAYEYDAFDAPTTLRELLPAPARPTAGTRTLRYDGDRLTHVDGVELSYDADGNVLSAPGVDGALVYGIWSELTAVGTTRFALDVDGLRLSACGEVETHTYVHDPGGYANPWREQADAWRALAETDWLPLPAGGDALTPSLAWTATLGTAAPDAGAAADPPDPLSATTPAWSAPLAALDRRLSDAGPAGTTRYVHGLGLIGAEGPDGSFASHVFDAQGSTLGLVGADGALHGRQSYDAFGARLGGDPQQQPFGFVGRYGVVADGPGLLSMRTRAYAPGLLRFSGQDYVLGSPADPLSLNRYAYVGNAPLLRIDPLGEDGFPVWGIVTLSIGGLLVLGGLGLLGAWKAGLLGGGGLAGGAGGGGFVRLPGGGGRGGGGRGGGGRGRGGRGRGGRGRGGRADPRENEFPEQPRTDTVRRRRPPQTEPLLDEYELEELPGETSSSSESSDVPGLKDD